VEDLADGLQAVMATLGGLVGSIVGYYFGESAAKTSPGSQLLDQSGRVPVQGSPDADGIDPADIDGDADEGK
jgi:hypothetical protein